MRVCPQPKKKEHKSIKELMKGSNIKRKPVGVLVASSEPRVVYPERKVKDGSEPLAFRRAFSLTEDDCRFLGESFPSGTWTCWCNRTVYRNGYPLYADLNCFNERHKECGEFRLMLMSGICGFKALRGHFNAPAPSAQGEKKV